MRYLACIVLLLVACTENRECPVCQTDPPEISLAIEAGSSGVEEVEIRLESANAGRIIWVGELPFSVKVEPGDSLTAHFSVDISGFDYNHPQCNCETHLGPDDCHEPYIVGSDTLWAVAE